MRTATLQLQEFLATRLNLVICLAGFAAPFIFPSPQIVTGTIVNTLFFVSAEKLARKDWYAALILPSLGAFAHGMLFGPQTIFLAYFLPVIWLGNYAQVELFSFLRSRGYAAGTIAAAAAKSLLLFGAANAYYALHAVPQVFITSMGAIQFITACLGGMAAYFITHSIKSHE